MCPDFRARTRASAGKTPEAGDLPVSAPELTGALQRAQTLAVLFALHDDEIKIIKESQTPREYQQMLFAPAAVPPMLTALIDLEEELQTQDLSLSRLDLELLTEHRDAGMRPPHVLPFAFTGFSSTYFGLLLPDRSQPLEMTRVPIVLYSDADPSARVIAENLHEFLSLLITVYSADQLDSIDENPEKIADLEHNLRETPEYWNEVQAVIQHLQQRFGVVKMTAPTVYLRNCRSRHQEVERWLPFDALSK